MTELYTALFIYIAVSTVASIISMGFVLTSSYGINSFSDYYLLPHEIYKTWKVNVFGSIFLSLLFFILVPLLWLVKGIIWLCTIGRR